MDLDFKNVKLFKQNLLLSSLNATPSDKVIYVEESPSTDANFIITNLMQQIFMSDSSVVLVILHNTIGHYHNVGKKLNYNFLAQVENGNAFAIEPLKTMLANLNGDNETFNYLTEKSTPIVRHLFADVKSKVDASLEKNTGYVYLIIDELIHLMDLDVTATDLLTFIKYCVSLTENDRVYLICGCHVAGRNEEDYLIATYLKYVADLLVQVSPLKTGRSNDVTGVVTIKRLLKNVNDPLVYHYKSADREIRMFTPGSALVYYK